MLRHLLIAIFMAALIFVAGCADAACRTPIDKRYMPAHNETRIYKGVCSIDIDLTKMGVNENGKG